MSTIMELIARAALAYLVSRRPGAACVLVADAAGLIALRQGGRVHPWGEILRREERAS